MSDTQTGFSLLLDHDGLDFQAALADWRWLVRTTVRPVAATLFGDMFLESQDGRVHFLDMLEGDFRHVAPSREDLRAFLISPDGDLALMKEVAELLMAQGSRLGPGECFGYKVPPALGAPLGTENIQTYQWTWRRSSRNAGARSSRPRGDGGAAVALVGPAVVDG